jgi:hypothetical protein
MLNRTGTKSLFIYAFDSNAIQISVFDGGKSLTTTVEVSDDNCGFKTLITVSRSSPEELSLNIQTKCENVNRTASSIGKTLKSVDVVKPFKENIVHQKAAESMPGCVVCSVPCAVTKAAWVELGMALRKDAKIQFMNT